MTQATFNKPAHEIRLNNIRAAIWENEVNGFTHYNVTFSCRYRDGDSWKGTHSFGRDDLLKVMKCSDLAHNWIMANSGKPELPQAEASEEAAQPEGSY